MEVGRLLDKIINYGRWGLVNADAPGAVWLGPARLLGNRLAGRRWKRHHSCRLAHHLLHYAAPTATTGTAAPTIILSFLFFFCCFVFFCEDMLLLYFFCARLLLVHVKSLVQRFSTNYSTATDIDFRQTKDDNNIYSLRFTSKYNFLCFLLERST